MGWAKFLLPLGRGGGGGDELDPGSLSPILLPSHICAFVSPSAKWSPSQITVKADSLNTWEAFRTVPGTEYVCDTYTCMDVRVGL